MAVNHNFLPFNNLCDVEFNLLFSDQNHLFPLSVINSLKFDKFNFDDSSNDYVLHEPLCEYYFGDESLSQKLSDQTLKLLSYNIASVPLHFDSLVDQLLHNLDINFDIIGFCETRLNDEISSLYRLSKFSFFYNNNDTSGGGVAILLRNHLTGSPLSNYSLQLPYIESLLIKVTRPLNFIIGMIYRPPNSNVDLFLGVIEDIVEYLSSVNLPCYLMGDFNINLLRNENKVDDLVNLLFSYNFFPTITKPTRVTSHSATLIDHIWSNNLPNLEISGIFYSSISDHFPIFNVFTAKTINSQLSHKPYFVKRIFNPSSYDSFRIALVCYNWKSDMIDNDVNASYDNYLLKFKSFYDQHFPLTQFTCKEKHVNKPYITQAIKISIKRRKKLERLYAKWPLTYDKQFKHYRNTLTSVIRAAKNDYYKSKLKANAGNTKKNMEYC